MSKFLVNNPVVWFLRAIVGPAAVMAAGMIGAGAVATRLLAGAWFGFDLLWTALYVIPMVIFTIDSGSRVGIMSQHRGMMDMIRTEISLALAWIIFIPQVFLNIWINMSQMSVMVESVYGILSPFGIEYPKNLADPFKLFIVAVLIALTVYASIGGFKRLQKVMTGLLMLLLLCFIIVAIRGLLQPSTWIGLVKGLIPKIPADIPIVGKEGVRNGFTQMMSIAGQALPAVVFLSYSYFTSNAEYTEADLKKNFRKTVLNLGVIWGLFSVMVVVAGATALHNVYIGANGGLHYSQISSVSDAGNVIAPAFPKAFDFLATPIFSLGLLVAAFTTMVSVALILVYITLDMLKMDWNFREGNKPFTILLALWIIIPGLLSPFFKLPALIQAILGMVGNLVMAPIAVVIIFFFINNKKYVGKYTANIGRNIILGITFAFSLYVVARGIVNFWHQLAG